MIGDPNQIRIFGKFNREEVLPEVATDDGLVLSFILTNLFANYESAFFSRSAGILGESEWERVERSVCAAFQRATQEEPYWRGISFRMTEEFVSFLESEC